MLVKIIKTKQENTGKIGILDIYDTNESALAIAYTLKDNPVEQWEENGLEHLVYEYKQETALINSDAASRTLQTLRCETVFYSMWAECDAYPIYATSLAKMQL